MFKIWICWDESNCVKYCSTSLLHSQSVQKEIFCTHQLSCFPGLDQKDWWSIEMGIHCRFWIKREFIETCNLRNRLPCGEKSTMSRQWHFWIILIYRKSEVSLQSLKTRSFKFDFPQCKKGEDFIFSYHNAKLILEVKNGKPCRVLVFSVWEYECPEW